MSSEKLQVGLIPGLQNSGANMGFFRRYKLTDYTADECRAHCTRIVKNIVQSKLFLTEQHIENDLEEWACFRELLARHEKSNRSPIDATNRGDYVRQLVFDVVQLSSTRLDASRLVTRLQEYGVGEWVTREVMQYLVDAGKLVLDQQMMLRPNNKCPYVAHANDCDCEGMGGDR